MALGTLTISFLERIFVSNYNKIDAHVYRVEYPKECRPILSHCDSSYIAVELPNGSRFLFTKRQFEVAREKATKFFSKMDSATAPE